VHVILLLLLRCWSSSAEVLFQRHPETARATNTQQTWRQEFHGSRSSTVQRSSTRTAAAGTFLRFFQTIFENTSLWRLKHLVTLSTYRRYINKCIYLCIYLLLNVFVEGPICRHNMTNCGPGGRTTKLIKSKSVKPMSDYRFLSADIIVR